MRTIDEVVDFIEETVNRDINIQSDAGTSPVNLDAAFGAARQMAKAKFEGVHADDVSECIHSWVKAQGLGGGHIFNYCNKCGATK